MLRKRHRRRDPNSCQPTLLPSVEWRGFGLLPANRYFLAQ